MKKVIASLLISALLLIGCENHYQDAISTLYEQQITPDISESPEANYLGELTLGPPGDSVPVRIIWTAGRDAMGCIKIINLKVERTGGNTDLVIDPVTHNIIQNCGAETKSTDETKFQTIVIKLQYKTSKGFSDYSFKGAVASIQGNGKFTDLRSKPE